MEIFRILISKPFELECASVVPDQYENPSEPLLGDGVSTWISSLDFSPGISDAQASVYNKLNLD